MNALKNITRSYFTFNRRERSGILFLFGILFLLLVAAIVQPHLYGLPEADYSAFDKMLVAMKPVPAEQNKFAEKEERDQPITGEKESVKHYTLKKQALFYFNPNGLDAEKWVELGLSPLQAGRIKKYEAKGGRFRTKADVQKMYVISPAFFARIENYIVIPAEEKAAPAWKTEQPVRNTTNARITVELNSADTTELKQLPGIGSAFARRIVTYRTRLGGFHSADQLLEVYGFDAERFDRIREQLTLNTDFLRRYNINTADVNELRSHPYLTPAIASAIVNYRRLHGPFASVEAIRQVDLVNGDLYLKLAPYLTR